jgi:hypothetical protein
MVTSPAPSTTGVVHRLYTQPTPLHTDPRDQPPSSRPVVVVRLELPVVDADGQQPAADHPGSGPSGASGRAVDRGIDPVRVARAVADLLRAIAPGVNSRVRVELTSASAGATVLDLNQPGDLRLDLDARTLAVDGRLVVLTRREFELLAYLHERRGVALSRRELMNAVWRTSYHGGDRTIDVHIRRLRVKLGRHAHRLRTLRGHGYRLD